MILMLPFLLITLHFSQIGFTEDLTFMMNPPFFAPSAPCRGIFCCKLLECVFFLWVRKKSTRKSSFYSIAFCSRKCKKFFTYFFIFFCSFSVHFFISPTGKKKTGGTDFSSLSRLFFTGNIFFCIMILSSAVCICLRIRILILLHFRLHLYNHDTLHYSSHRSALPLAQWYSRFLLFREFLRSVYHCCPYSSQFSPDTYDYFQI